MKKVEWQIGSLKIFVGVLFLGLSGCVQSGNLAEHSLEGKTVAVVSEIPNAPFADFDMTIFDRVGQDVPIMDGEPKSRQLPHVAINTSDDDGNAPRPVSKVHVLIDSVLVDFDMSEVIVKAAHNRTASFMRFEAIEMEEQADYILKVIVDDYGIGSDAWNSTAYFEVMGRLKLIENKTDKTVWEGEVVEIAPLTKALLSVGIPAADMETPAGLAKIPIEEMQEVLAGLANYASIQLVAPLREAYFNTRVRESARIESKSTAHLPSQPASPYGQ
ncbi:MAG: hypothetical protein AB8G77_21325 [Rhodothermales bacterium]